jgi:hypothetical protein
VRWRQDAGWLIIDDLPDAVVMERRLPNDLVERIRVTLDASGRAVVTALPLPPRPPKWAFWRR